MLLLWCIIPASCFLFKACGRAESHKRNVLLSVTEQIITFYCESDPEWTIITIICFLRQTHEKMQQWCLNILTVINVFVCFRICSSIQSSRWPQQHTIEFHWRWITTVTATNRLERHISFWFLLPWNQINLSDGFKYFFCYFIVHYLSALTQENMPLLQDQPRAKSPQPLTQLETESKKKIPIPEFPVYYRVYWWGGGGNNKVGNLTGSSECHSQSSK